ncbi:Phosphinothricin N-acetyltransferase [Burkholderiales bacterium 8X]|nr:Phosphinothricin N-acetyltransferase [Burkholderiales bacterium 8X]
MTLIRPSRPEDVARITAIYAHHVRHGTGTFETDPPTEEDMAARRQDVLSKNLPYLVAEKDGDVLGFAYCNWFKPRPAYRFSAEDSIYIDDKARGQRVGTELLSALVAASEKAGIRKLIAVIGDSANLGSINLHRAQGFGHVGVLKDCGWKFDKWLDVVLMERELGAGSSTSPA